jgi:short-chain fatty acids transporter
MALHPRTGALTLSPSQVDAILPRPPGDEPAAATPAGRLDSLRVWVWLAALLLGYPLLHSMVTRGFGATWTINAYNGVFLVAALLLHGRPLPFLRACRDGVDAAWGIIVQFPLYAGIFGLMQDAHLGGFLAELFASVATPHTFPLAVYVYSALMNLFVPSGGSKWLIEAPFLLPAADALGVSPVTTVLAYGYGDSTTNLIQPFFAIPILSIARMRFGDVVGFTFLVAAACFAASVVAMLLIPLDL